jgi:hypothetical protein
MVEKLNAWEYGFITIYLLQYILFLSKQNVTCIPYTYSSLNFNNYFLNKQVFFGCH